MPIIKSAKKRVRVSNKAAIRNSKTKRQLKSAIKLFHATPADKTLRKVNSEIDKAAKKNVIHKNKAARLKKRASIKAKSAKVTLSKTTTKKTSTSKKPAVKK